jgi:thiosulfate/3-mercaptopyruvate sulfurtransferase
MQEISVSNSAVKGGRSLGAVAPRAWLAAPLRLLVLAALLCASAATCYSADLGLIDATVLKSNQAKWVILDARPKADWEAGHIPGALPFSWEDLTRTDPKGVKYSSIPPEELARALAKLGIDEKTPVVLYGDAGSSWGSEGYGVWLLSWLGHRAPVRLLAGGFQAWNNRKLALVKGSEKPGTPKAGYQVSLKPQYLATTEEIQKSKDGYALIDVRSGFEWFKGRIPGAVHIPWEEFYAGNDHHPLPAAELQQLLARHGVTGSKPVVFYCLGGVRSAYAWTVYQLAGLPAARNYKGSWAAWEKRSGQ